MNIRFRPSPHAATVIQGSLLWSCCSQTQSRYCLMGPFAAIVYPETKIIRVTVSQWFDRVKDHLYFVCSSTSICFFCTVHTGKFCSRLTHIFSDCWSNLQHVGNVFTCPGVPSVGIFGDFRRIPLKNPPFSCRYQTN